MPPLLIAAAIGQTLVASTTLSAADRVPAVVVVLTPFGSGSAVGTSRYVRAMARVLARRTDLRGLSPEQAGIDLPALTSCPARRQLTCWTDVVRGAANAPRKPPRFLFSLAVRRVDANHDRVSLTMLDTTAAERLRTIGAEEQREDALFRQTRRSRPVRIARSNDRALLAALDAVVKEHFSTALQSAQHWAPFGAVYIESTCNGCEVLVDDRIIGISRPGRLRIVGLRQGPHAVEFRTGDRVTRVCPTAAVPGRSITVPSSACTTAEDASSSGKQLWLRYGGLASGIAGLALITYGIIQANDAPTAICVVPSGASAADCDELGAPGLSFNADPELTTRAADVNPSGLPTVALGAGLVGAGATWATGSWLWEDWPWWAHALTGVAVGGAAVTVGVVAGAE